MAAEGFPVARIDEYAKPCEPAIHVLRSVVRVPKSGRHTPVQAKVEYPPPPRDGDDGEC